LTARGEITDKIVGLELGADDYLAKPFDARELLARIQSVLRRTGAPREAESIRIGQLEIDMDTRSATLAGQPLGLTTTEFEALALFASQPGKVFSREQIMEHLRGIDWQTYHRSADVLISRLRQKLKDDPKKPTWFKTIWGSGYMFLPQRGDRE
jgi:DNA-binding response OmpR family regulator